MSIRVKRRQGWLCIDKENKVNNEPLPIMQPILEEFHGEEIEEAHDDYRGQVSDDKVTLSHFQLYNLFWRNSMERKLKKHRMTTKNKLVMTM